MSTQPIDDGGQAFPVPAGNYSGAGTWLSSNGMTLRDYFAAQALLLFADARVLAAIRDEARASGKAVTVLFAAAAYDVADAMIAQRKAT